MNDLIQWVDLKTRSHRLDLSDYDFSIFRTIKSDLKKNYSAYLSFSEFFTTAYKNTKFLKVGIINENGVKLFFNKSDSFVRMRVSSRPLVDLIFEKLGKDANRSTN